MAFANRIQELRYVKASELAANPKNWREHPEQQRQAMKTVLDSIGIAGALLARKTPAGLELIDGHLRTDMDQNQEWPVLILDVDQQEADAILATFDPLSAMAETNNLQLKALLHELTEGNSAIDDLLKQIAADAKISFDIPTPKDSPDDFAEVDESIAVNCKCPRCGYQWNDANKPT